ncbi:hypothetical protein J5N97_024146 [Dioscorea zingiberensis]|uniref:Coiled-coil SMC6 And NSE5 INteracting (CANIN) domain-containing protein n=1 Tax=Dioscorea zingiberensis TaxID=325984 RepID=A0A9D5C6X2_9LILI|nr:hypothetical protein J5N97_024146 [Dioscorea zingiberensis]
MAMDEPLDFEAEDKLLFSVRPTTKRRKVIGLDDLLTDYYAEKGKDVQSQSKKGTMAKGSNSDDEDDKAQKNKERMLSEFVNECQKQVHEMSTEDNIPLWGLRIFQHQQPPPPMNFLKILNCKLLQTFKKKELDSIFETKAEEGENFLEGLLINGWLSKLVLSCGSVENSIASWTFNQMLYSSKDELQEAACDFWCSVLLSKTEVDEPVVKLSWFPCYADLNDALKSYGFLSDASYDCSSVSTIVKTDFDYEGPPINIGSWVKILSTCCQFRSVRPIFSTSEAEELLQIIIWLFLDRDLIGLSYCLCECMQSIIAFFMENEWNNSCRTVAEAIAYRTPKDVNCLRIVECVSGVDDRSKQLKGQLALQILLVTFDKKDASGKEILELLLSMSLKDKDCDFLRLYIYLDLVSKWLLYDHLIAERDELSEMWCKFLRNCSSQITSIDWRSYASKVRNKASYLLQNTVQKRNT